MARKRQRTTDADPQPARPENTRAAPPTAPPRFINAGLILLIILAGALAYATSFGGGFVFDDARYIADYEHIDQFWPPWPHLATRRPVVQLSLALNYAISGLNTWSYHLFNLVVHLLAGLTLFGLVRRTLLLPRWAGRFATSASYFAAAVAGLWVVHPLNTQSVVYIVQRGEALMGLFYLLTIYSVLRGSTGRADTAWYLLAIIACALGMATKGVMISAPLVVLIYDRVFLADSWAGLLRKRWWLYVGLFLTIGVLALVGVAQGIVAPQYPKFATVGFGYQGATPFDYLRTEAGVVLHYIRLAFVPYPLILDYDWPAADQPLKWLLPGLVIVILLVATVLALWRKPGLGFAGVWFFLILAPTSSIVPIRDAAFEHRMYLSLAAIILLVVFGVYALLRRFFQPAAAFTRGDHPRRSRRRWYGCRHRPAQSRLSLPPAHVAPDCPSPSHQRPRPEQPWPRA